MGACHLCVPTEATARSSQDTALDSGTTTTPVPKEMMSGHWHPPTSELQNPTIRMLSPCFWKIVSVFLFLLVIHKKRRKSQKDFFFQSPIKKEFRRANQSDALGYFLPLVFLQTLTKQRYQTGLSKLNITVSSLSHSDLTWTNWAFTKRFKGSKMSLRTHSLSPLLKPERQPRKQRPREGGSAVSIPRPTILKA